MGVALSFLTLYEVARITVPTFFDAVTGRIDRESCDRRLAEFARRVVERARIRLEVVGRENVPPERAFVYMSNHQSHLDVPIIYAAVPARTLRMVAKAELFKIPVWGQAIRAAGMIEVNRANQVQAIASLERAGEAIRDGVSVWIAPEGTRSVTGEIGDMKKGGFHLAVATGTPIVPVAISGTYEVLPPHGRSMSYDVPVRVTLGAPIETHGRDVESLRREVREFLVAHV